MTIWQAVLLGIVQGLTEFIPISSTAHLTITGKLLGLIRQDAPEQWTAFIAVIQIGTLIAVLAYFRSDILSISRSFILASAAFLRKQPVEKTVAENSRLGWLIIIGTIPIAVAGVTFKDIIEGRLTKNLWVISSSLIGLAILLVIAELVAKQSRDMKSIRIADAVIVGIAQCFALIPGSSRSGTTITGGLFSGLTRESSARFSFLLSIPAITASGLFELPVALRAGGTDWTSLITATIVSAISGYLSIAFLLRFLQRHTTFLFAAYRIAIGLLIIVLLLSGRLTAD
ncbi:MAG TPA: undecaprenyl-diphosphatase UppP [Blastocatellia bacterium]|nr:undecaprenyl-diphosphatase UppP [Blastocatellia bacterium]